MSLFLVGIGYNANAEGKLTIRSDDNKNTMTINSELGVRYGFKRENDKNDIDFELTKSALKFSGQFFDEKLTYLFKTANFHELKFKDDKITMLSKYYIDYVFCKSLAKRVGKFDLPFARESLSIIGLSTGSLVSEKFQPHKNKGVGVLVHNGTEGQIEYMVAIVDSGVGARLGYNFGQIEGYKYSDKAGGDLRFGIGLAGFSTFKYTEFKFDDNRLTLDAITKFNHFTIDGSVYYLRDSKEKVEDNKNKFGGQLGANYLINSVFEPVVRYSFLKPEKNYFHEVMGGFGYYLFEDHLKVQGSMGIDLSASKMQQFKTGIDLYFNI